MRGPYTWDQRSYSYRGANGRFVSAREVRGAIDGALESAQAEMRTLSQSLQAGRISLADWQAGMQRQIKSVHLYSAAAAKGGWDRMTPADFGRVGRHLAQGPAGGEGQYQYLRRFAADIASGKQPLDGRFLARVDLYAQSGRATYHETERREMQVRGFTEERNVLGVADHCPGCLRETGRGWVGIGEIVRIGGRDCRTRCRCALSYRNPDTGATRAA